MKRVFVFLLSFILVSGLAACSSKPSSKELAEAFVESSFNTCGVHGVDLGQYLEVSDFDIVDSYEEKPFYILQGKATIQVVKSLDQQEINKMYKHKGPFGKACVFKTIRIFEIISDYSRGLIDEKDMVISVQMAGSIGPKGTLKVGDEFETSVASYKFRKTDNGWVFVE